MLTDHLPDCVRHAGGTLEDQGSIALHRRLHRYVVLVLGVAVLIPATAGARNKVIAPPGNSGLDQYVETIPDASGNRIPSHGRPPSLGNLGRELQSQGSAGQATARVLATTAPPRAIRRLRAWKPRAETPVASPGVRAAEASGTSYGGLSVSVPIVMGASLLGAIAFAVARRRVRATPPPDDDAS
jgi:hypothetical protein